MSFEMTVDDSEEKGICAIKISGDLTIYEANDFATQLQNHISNHDIIKVDLEKVNDFDTAGCQVLISLKKTLVENGKDFRWGARSNTVDSFLNLLGLLESRWFEKND